MEMLKDKNGKTSSKRMWGTILLGSATIMAIAGGFEVYAPVESLVQMMFLTGAGTIGLGTFESKK